MAMVAGISLPLMSTVITNIFPPEKIGVPMGMGGLVIGLAPRIGLLMGAGFYLEIKVFRNFTIWVIGATLFLAPFVLLIIVTVLTHF
ncbi:hypothetical protein ICE98_00250 [Lactococcus lactis]|nr:hypothetical protein [Lactococcus lactis]